MRRENLHTALPLLLALALIPGALADNWTSAGKDPQRTAWSPEENDLTPSNAKSITLLWKAHVDNQPKELNSLTGTKASADTTSATAFKEKSFTPTPRSVLLPDLLEQLPHRRLQLTVFSRVGLPDRPCHRHVHRPRVQLHRLPVVRRDARTGHPDRRAVHECLTAREDDPSGRRLADDLAEVQRAVAFREVLGIRERMLIRDEDRRQLE